MRTRLIVVSAALVLASASYAAAQDIAAPGPTFFGLRGTIDF